jgi:hypothetical protein
VSDRIVTIDVPLKIGETMHLTVVSDAHLDDARCDWDGLKRMADARAKLPNHRAIFIGDAMSLIVPPDSKRWQPQCVPPEIAGRNDWLNAAVDYVKGRLDQLGWTIDLVGTGNHEHELERRYGYDTTTLLAHHAGAVRGGYSGMVQYRLNLTKTSRAHYNVLFHHGRWGGKNKGLAGAREWAEQRQGWDLMVFGHNHAAGHWPEVRMVPDHTLGNFVPQRVDIVNCASWLALEDPDPKNATYGEVRAFRSEPHLSPLIRLTPIASRVQGHTVLDIDCKVEL